MKKVSTLILIFLLTVPMFLVLLPKAEAAKSTPENLLTSLDSAFSNINSLSEQSCPKTVSATSIQTFSANAGSANILLSNSEVSLGDARSYSVDPLAGMDGLYIGYARTDDYANYPNEQFDFGTTIGIWVDVDNSWSGTRYVDIFVYLRTPNLDIIDGDSVYNIEVTGTGDSDAQYLSMYNGFDYMQYVGAKWHILIIVRDHFTYESFEQRVYITIGPILKDHFTCRDPYNAYATRTSTFYDTETAWEYTAWDTHNLWITYEAKWDFNGPGTSHLIAGPEDLSPGQSSFWVAGGITGGAAGSWYVDVLLDDNFRARDGFDIIPTVLPSLDVGLVSPTDGATVETSPIELRARVTSDGSSVQNALVKFYVAGSEVDSDYSDSSGYASINYYPPTPNTYNWKAKATKSGYTEGTSSTRSFTYSPPVQYTISLSSRTDDGQTNIGSIKFDEQTYSLPATVSKSEGTYQVIGNPPDGYSFDPWEYSGSIIVSDPTSQTTSVAISGNCALKAVFSLILVPDFEISVNPSSATVDQGSSTEATVTVTSINGYGYSVSLSATGQPSGVTITFDPTSGTPTFMSNMALQVAYNVPEDTYSITITGTGSNGKTHFKTFDLTVNKISFPTDPRLQVYQRSYIATISEVSVSFTLYGITKGFSASDQDYRSAIYQHFGISLSGDFQNEYLFMFEVSGLCNLADYLKEQWWSSWMFTEDFVSYVYSQHDADGAVRYAWTLRYTLTGTTIARLGSMFIDIAKVILAATTKYGHVDVAIKNALSDFIKLIGDNPFETGLYYISLTSPSNTRAILNFSSVVIAQWMQNISDLLDNANFYIKIIVIGFRLCEIIAGFPVSLFHFLISTVFGLADCVITLYLHDYVPTWFADLIHVVASWIDPPNSAAEVQVFLTTGQLLLGWNSTSDEFIEYSTTGFILGDNTTQIVFMKKLDPVILGIAGHGEEAAEIPYSLSIVDDYGNRSYGTTGFIRMNESVSIVVNIVDNVVEFGNHLIVKTNVSTTVPIQGQPVTVNIAVNDTAGSRADVTVALLINKVTWVIADNLGSGQYQATIDTWSLLGLVPIAIYADYPDMTTGYDTFILDVSDAPPDINILSPQNTTYTTSTIDLTFAISEPTSWTGYTLDGQANITITGNTTLTGLLEGSHFVIVYANDTSGNMGVSSVAYFSVDTIAPNILILSPQNTTYYVSLISLAFSVNESTSWIGYSLDGQSNVTISGNTMITVECGTHTIIVYANDTAGNMGSSETVYFTIENHDISVTDVTQSKTVVGQNYTLRINVTLENQGDFTETLNITIYANVTLIRQTEMNLTTGNSTTITFTWNTTGFAKGNCTIWAHVEPVQGETNTADNTFTDGWVFVTIPGDVDGDRDVDIYDVVKITGIYGSKRGDPQFNPNSDLDDDDEITIYDVVICTSHYRQSW